MKMTDFTKTVRRLSHRRMRVEAERAERQFVAFVKISLGLVGILMLILFFAVR